jgi:hypothetical protein
MDAISTFFFQFEADAGALKSGLKEAEGAAEKTAESVKKVDKSASLVGKNFKVMLGAIGGLIYIPLKLATGAAKLGAEITKAANAAGVGAEDWQKLKFAFEQSEADAGDLTNVLKKLRESGKEPIEGMLELADAMAGMSDEARRAKGKELGISPEAVALLSKGRSEVQKYAKELTSIGAIITDDELKKLDEFGDSWRTLGITLKYLRTQIALFLLPAVRAVVGGFTNAVKFFNQHPFFKGVMFVALAAIIGKTLIPVVLRLAAVGVAAVLPWLPLIAVLAAVLLIAEDIWGYFNGYDSVTGRVVKAIGEWLDKGSLFAQALKDAWVVALDIVDAIASVWKWLGKCYDFVMESLAPAFEALGKVGDFIKGFFSVNTQAGLDMANAMGGDTGIEQANVGAQFAAASTSPAIRNSISNNASTRTSNTNIGTITVNTQATDAKAISRDMSRELKRATQQNDNGAQG